MKNLIFILVVLTGLNSAQAQSTSSFTPQQIENYMARLSSMLTGRPLNAAERSTLRSEGYVGLERVLQSWVDSEFFVKSSRIQIQTQLGVSGNDGTINYELPANLLDYLIRQNRPYSEILTADYCVDNNRQRISCDTGSPFVAGVLTTRAFLKQYSGRFNLSRASNTLRQFACQSYPMSTTLQPRLPRESLIPMFAADLAIGAAEFGNGTACYACHGQFSAHTQFFVKFDAFGVYKAAATGLQNPNLEPGLSVNDLFTSHMVTSDLARSEVSQMFGQTSNNLREAAQALVNNANFTECSVRNSVRYFIRLTDGNETINRGVVKDISAKLKQKYQDPSFKQIVFESLRHPMVIGSLLMAGQ
ncbi:MAG: hypothetical protein SGJ18_03835 [Pseudomonadota bacterium]|nr:hypothetical protein [Pseudomonadota bacterium]